MNRIIFLVIASLTVITGLAVVHFSLVNAQPGPFPLASHISGTPHTATPTPTSVTPTPTPPVIHTCYKNHNTDAEKQDQLRVVSDPTKCNKNETALSWTAFLP